MKKCTKLEIIKTIVGEVSSVGKLMGEYDAQ